MAMKLPNNPEEIIAALHMNCDSYKQALKDKLGCCVSHFKVKLCNNDYYHHFKLRKQQINELKTILNNNNYSYEEKIFYFNKYLNTINYHKSLGQTFKLSCSLLLLRYLDNTAKKEENLCIICLSNHKSILSMPCGHMTYCDHCRQDQNFNDRFHDECAVCRGGISQTIALDPEDMVKYCLFCNKKPKDILVLPCQHLLSCSDCLENWSITKCPTCDKTITETKKIFH